MAVIIISFWFTFATFVIAGPVQPGTDASVVARLLTGLILMQPPTITWYHYIASDKSNVNNEVIIMMIILPIIPIFIWLGYPVYNFFVIGNAKDNDIIATILLLILSPIISPLMYIFNVSDNSNTFLTDMPI